jgi:hypothetical protein
MENIIHYNLFFRLIQYMYCVLDLLRLLIYVGFFYLDQGPSRKAEVSVWLSYKVVRVNRLTTYIIDGILVPHSKSGIVPMSSLLGVG